ncbi:unnamed protein product [Clonostachys rhizophaga]|uniref:catechol O-methyltransferase n=1 Tax=Clonostachys rhizophaga TaxID=160324 RepID=A0A9N9VEL3_9HYPO|nr:unnamed protein product [Clonostachys rhizophaga]
MGVVTDDLPRRSTRLQARHDHVIKSNRSTDGPQQKHRQQIKEEDDAPVERQTSLIVKSRQPKLAKLLTPSRLIRYVKTTSACRSPPIHGSRFGLIQEKLGHNLYELLVAAMLWNRTRGMQAKPIFLALVQQYPTPDHLAKANLSELADLIRPIGLYNSRAKRFLLFAQAWLLSPPSKERRYRRMHYPSAGDGKDVGPTEILDKSDFREGWEVAHLPGVGPYALDSFRIFHRDILRGLAKDWEGTGATPGFEPEWKRVVPSDKELKAYIRWRWLKEGYVWDPATITCKISYLRPLNMEERRKLYGKYPSLRKLEELGDAYVEWNDGREPALLRWLYDHASFPEMRSNPRVICDAMDEYAAQHNFLINIGPDKAEKVAALISEKKPKIFVELGGYVGYSALWFGNALKNAHKDSTSDGNQVVYWSLEADPVFAGIAMNLVDLAGLGDVVKIVTGKAAESLTHLKEEGKFDKVDMLFLDHIEDLYVADLKVAESLGLLKKGSIVVADNVLRPGAPEYKKYVEQHPSMDTRAIKGLIIPGEFEDEIEVTEYKG